MVVNSGGWRRALRRGGWLAGLGLALLWGACDCGGDGDGDGSGRPCTTNAECADRGEVCVAGRCQPPRDAEPPPRPDGGRPDAGDGGGRDAGRPPECVADEDCDGGVCLDGTCCGAADACGSRCCDGAGGEVCFAGACVVPGEACLTHADCGEGAYCERGLGGDGPTMDGGVGSDGGACLGETPSPGRCLAFPPECGSPGADPATCIRAECPFVPSFDRLNATLQWRWGAAHDPPRPGEVAAATYRNRVDVGSTPAVGRVHDTNCDGVVDRRDPPAVVFVSLNAHGTCCSCGDWTESCQDGVLRVLDGATGQELWSARRAFEGSRGFAGVSVALGDLDGEPGMEVVALTGEGRVAVYRGDGTLLGLSDAEERVAGFEARTFGWGGALALADMEGDGVVEIAYGRDVFEWRDGAVVRKWRGAGASGRTIPTFADLDGDGQLELLAGRTAYEPDGTILWNLAGASDGYAAVADFDEDGRPEVVLVQPRCARRNGDGTCAAWVGDLSLLDGSDGTRKWGPLQLGGSGQGGPPTVADFDGDGRPEVGVAQANYYSLVDVEPDASPVLSIKWRAPTHDYSSSVTGSTVFDFEGDGQAEVVYNDECFLWVYDGENGSVRFTAPTTSYTATEASLVADVDGDGHAEILLVSNGADPNNWHCRHHQSGGSPPSHPGTIPDEAVWKPGPGPLGTWRGVSVWRDVENSWVGTRPLWNQHTYHVTNVCAEGDDACDPPRPEGSIPASERANWTVSWLNNFRQNVQQRGLFDAPDATVSLQVQCTEPPVLLASVRNRGRALLPAGVVVGFYERQADGTERRLGEMSTDRELRPGQAAELRFEAPAGTSPRATFFARIEVDPDARTFRECDEDNNQSEDVQAVCLG